MAWAVIVLHRNIAINICAGSCIGLLMLRSGLKEVKSITDWRQYGGAPVLGFDHLLIKAHGRSNEQAITNALKVADRSIRYNLQQDIAQTLEREFGGGVS